ncbi:putative short chain dehydrogenase [Rosellinia necatrix]|uniref:Putative short chain dehydrogenase n=1 Tax=Rosellinia necatrix TaxID=77044 RepID=A0A1W2TJQ4_ROSNE|nr:putative short chain dehydrogenase [Rosellinia necatrix]
MPSYVITGVSKGLGFEFLRQISQEPSNTVVGIVRDKTTTVKKVQEELSGRSNIHILEADITDYNAIKRAVEDTATLTGGTLDYLVANAAYVSQWDAYDPIGTLGNKPQELEDDLLKSFKVNVVSNIHLLNQFVPLILKGQAKKVIVLSTGNADLDPIRLFDADIGAGYAISKAAMNVAVAKFSAQYKKDGVLFISICPGLADTGQFANATPEQLQSAMGLMGKFQQYAPHFKGPARPEDAVKAVISVWEKASIENGDGGAFVSHYGNKQWL